jgi:exodeoxyribonuclease VII large subunit
MDMNQHIYTVSAITDLLKEIIEGTFPRITIEGEISNFRPSSTGHWYFTLKDTNAALSAAMFKNRLFRVGFRPADGQKVRVTGSLSVYSKRGTYQIICDSMTKVGTGDILEMLEARKRAFQAEGLFDSSRKKPLPMLPKKIVIITSPTGAALRDILQVLHRRNARVAVTILPVPVQGDDAAAEIALMLDFADRHQLGEVIIIGRGGGSVEDLLPFSEEIVVRAVAHSSIPVISAVGHEVDWALSDFAADMRAPTPSAAAELVTAEMQTVEEAITHHRQTIISEMTNRVNHNRLRLNRYSPESFYEVLHHTIDASRLHIDDFKEQICNTVTSTIKDTRHRLGLVSQKLQANSPIAILERGFAIVTEKTTGKTITSITEITAGMETTTLLTDGSFDSRITGE